MHEPYVPSEMLLSEDGYYRPLCPVEDEFVAGEIVNRWFHREQSRRLKDMHEIEMLKFDAELAELLFRRKQTLCRPGRNGEWSLWLRQQKISRSTADRLVAQYSESHGLADELHHRQIVQPLEGNVSLAASRVYKRLKNMLSTPWSRMVFLRCLADRLGLGVDLELNGSVRLYMPPPASDEDMDGTVPNVIEMQQDGSVRPVNYELRNEEEDSVFYRDVRRIAQPDALQEQHGNLSEEFTR